MQKTTINFRLSGGGYHSHSWSTRKIRLMPHTSTAGLKEEFLWCWLLISAVCIIRQYRPYTTERGLINSNERNKFFFIIRQDNENRFFL